MISREEIIFRENTRNDNIYRIEFDRDEQKEKYLEGLFLKNNIEYGSVKTDRTIYGFRCLKEDRDGILSGLIFNFYKLNEIMKVFCNEQRDGAFYALVGALIGLDGEEDLQKISLEVQKSDFINVDGFYNFCISEIKESWRGLANLAYRLYSQCHTSDEVYALCIFMLGMGDNVGETIVISSKKELYWELSKTFIEIIPYFGERENDLIVTLLSNRPSDVIVSDPNCVSEKFLSVIRALGE